MVKSIHQSNIIFRECHNFAKKGKFCIVFSQRICKIFCLDGMCLICSSLFIERCFWYIVELHILHCVASIAHVCIAYTYTYCMHCVVLHLYLLHGATRVALIV